MVKKTAQLPEDNFTSYLGMIIGVGSFAMLFIALFASYGVLRIRAGVWMGYTIGTLPLILLWVNTVIICSSSYILFKSGKSIKAGNLNTARKYVFATLCFGAGFLLMQIILWNTLIAEGFIISAHQAGSVFYMLSGLHGLHVLGGLAALMWLLLKLTQNKFKEKHGVMVGMFWHFLTVVWIAFFILVVIV
ncbi:MAG: heme-copper oxidase subunit III [Candidatus Marinimicrobia bacterium]|nr:heme-copper oxidase subunit III [Candidatus Neomarinimicrobiota bacterium]